MTSFARHISFLGAPCGISSAPSKAFTPKKEDSSTVLGRSARRDLLLRHLVSLLEKADTGRPEQSSKLENTGEVLGMPR